MGAIIVVLALFLLRAGETPWKLYYADIVTYSDHGSQTGWVYGGSFSTPEKCLEAGMKTFFEEYDCTISPSWKPTDE